MTHAEYHRHKEPEGGRNSYDRWKRIIEYFKRQAHKRKRQNKEQQPEIKAAKDTARASWIMAVFTFALVVIAVFQWQEVVSSNDSLDRMNRIYRSQTAQLNRQASETNELAEKTRSLADQMKRQADHTQIIAEQAVIQAKATLSTAETARDSLIDVQRAIVSSTGLEGVRVASDDGKNIAYLEFTITLENSGTTPTRNMR